MIRFELTATVPVPVGTSVIGWLVPIAVIVIPDVLPMIRSVTTLPETSTLPEVVTEDKVPTDVMFGCAAVYTVPETSAFAT